jgi:hypothetical protein
MSRSLYFGALVSVALLAAPLVGQNSAMVRGVSVRGTDDAIEVEIQTSGAPVSPDTQAITGPDRIVVDFPGALPSSELRALKVNRGVLKGIRSGLFFNNPPITRVVLDLSEPREYRISTSQNAIVVKLGPGGSAPESAPSVAAASGARLRDASLASGTSVPAARLSTATMASANILHPSVVHPGIVVSRTNGSNKNVADANLRPLARAVTAAPPEPPNPALSVTYENGMLRIHADKATLAQVLFEVHQQTQADIAIPAGAEQERVVADLGPAPARDVLGALLNGSAYNFVFVGDELALERVILTRRDPNIF